MTSVETTNLEGTGKTTNDATPKLIIIIPMYTKMTKLNPKKTAATILTVVTATEWQSP